MTNDPSTTITVFASSDKQKNYDTQKNNDLISDINDYCQKESKNTISFSLDDVQDWIYYCSDRNEIYIDFLYKGYLINLAGFDKGVVNATWRNGKIEASTVDPSIYGNQGEIGIWSYSSTNSDGTYEYSLFFPKSVKNKSSGLNVGDVCALLYEAYLFLVSAQPPENINPYSRFSSDSIALYSKSIKNTSSRAYIRLTNVVDACKKRWKNADIQVWAALPQNVSSNWAKVMDSTMYTAFEVYQKKAPSSKNPDIFSISNKNQALGQLYSSVNNSESSVQQITQDNVSLKKKAKRSNTLTIMGCSANTFAQALTGSTALVNSYEWCHRLGHALTANADRSDNLFMGTSYCNSWMMIYEYQARRLRGFLQGGSVVISCENVYGSNLSNYAPSEIVYKVCYNTRTITTSKLSAWDTRQPSKWLNALMKTECELWRTQTVLPSLYKRGSSWQLPSPFDIIPHTYQPGGSSPDPHDQPGSGTQPGGGTQQGGGTQPGGGTQQGGGTQPGGGTQQGGGSPQPTAPSPFPASTAASTLPCPPVISQLIQGGTNVSPQTLASFLGLDEITGLRAMTDTEKAAYYQLVTTIDPDAANYFPSPQQGTGPGEECLVGDTTYLGQSMTLRSFVKMLDSNTLAHVTALAPSSSVFDGLGSFTSPRFMIYENPQSGGDAQDIGLLRFAAIFDVSSLFAFIPNMPSGLTLELAGDLNNASVFSDLDSDTPIKLWGSLDSSTSIELNSHCSLRSLSLGVSLTPQFRMLDASTTMIFDIGLAATLDLTISDSQTLTFEVAGGKEGDTFYLSGSADDWTNPFGLSGFTLDSVSFNLTFNPFRIEVAAYLQVSSWLRLHLAGSYDPTDGLAVMGQIDDTLCLEDLIDMHQQVTGAQQPLQPGSDVTDIALSNITVSFCTNATVIDGVSCPQGFALKGDLQVQDNAATVQASIIISPSEGIQFSGAVSDLSMGPVTLDTADLQFQICPKYPAQNFLQASGSLTILDHYDLTVLMRLGKAKCVFARLDELNFKLSDIDASLSWLDFRFTDLTFSYASQAMTVSLPANQGNTLESVDLVAGEVLSGSVTFALLTKLFGKAMPFGFAYDFSQSQFAFDLTGGNPTANLGSRMAPPTGLNLAITDANFVCDYATSFTLFDSEVDLAAGFTIGPPSGDDAMTINFFAKYQGDLHFKFPLASNPIVIESFALDADVSLGGSFGEISLSGSFEFGKDIVASLAFTLAADPEQDAFRAEIDNATLEALLTFGLQVVGIDIPPLPVVDQIIVHKLVFYYAPQGMHLGTTIYPPGFSFDADMSVFGEEVEALVALSGDKFTIDLSMSPLSLGPLSIKGADGKDPHFNLSATPDSAVINLDCAVDFLDMELKTLINIKTPSTYDFDLTYELLGTELAIHGHSESHDSYQLSATLGDDQTAQSQQKIIDQILQAAKKMEQDAQTIQGKAQAIQQAYNQGLSQLNGELTSAQQAFDQYAAQLKSEFQGEQQTLNQTQSDAQTGFNNVLSDLQNNKAQAAAALGKLDSKLNNDLTQAKNELNKQKQTLQATIQNYQNKLQAAKQKFDADMASAQANLQTCQQDVTDMQNQLQTIQNAKPHGRHCSHSDTEKWEKDVKEAQRNLDKAQQAVTSANDIISTTKTNYDQEVDQLQATSQNKQQTIQNEIQQSQQAIAQLQEELNADINPDLINQLAKLDYQKKLMENKYQIKISQLQQETTINQGPDQYSSKKATLDVGQAQTNITRLQSLQSQHDNSPIPAGDQQLVDQAVTGIQSEVQPILDHIPPFVSNYNQQVNELKTNAQDILNVLPPKNVAEPNAPDSVISNIDSILDSLGSRSGLTAPEDTLQVLEALDNLETQMTVIANLVAGDLNLSILINAIHNMSTYLQVPAYSGDVDDLQDAVNQLPNNLASAQQVFKQRGEDLETVFKFLYQISDQPAEALQNAATDLNQQLQGFQQQTQSVEDLNNACSNIKNNYLEQPVSLAGPFTRALTQKLHLLFDYLPGGYQLASLKGLNQAEAAIQNVQNHVSEVITAAQNLSNLTNSDYPQVFQGISNVVTDLNFVQSLVVKNQPLFDPSELSDAQTSLASVTATKTQHDQAITQSQNSLQSQIDQLNQNYQNNLAQINSQIQQLESQLPSANTLKRLEADFNRAVQVLQNHEETGQQALNQLQQTVDSAQTHAQNLQTSSNLSQSPAGQRLQTAKTNVESWKNGQLAKDANTLTQSAQAAAKEAQAAALIYQKVATENTFSIGHITLSADWTGSDLTFDFDITFDFELNIDVGLIHIHIHLPEISLNFNLDLREIETFFQNVFEYLWDKIKDAL